MHYLLLAIYMALGIYVVLDYVSLIINWFMYCWVKSQSSEFSLNSVVTFVGYFI